MKRFLSVVLAVMMIFSTVSFAVPSLVGVQETARNVGYFEEPDLKENFEEKEETATLAAVDTTQYGQLVAKFTFDNLVSGTSYADAFRKTDQSLNPISVIGGSIGSGDHMNSWVKTTTPFMWDGMNNGTERHSTVVGAQDGNGNKYLQLTGTGSDARFAIRDYNGAGFAKAGHYIVTFDVLSASNTKPVSAIQFQGNSNKFNHIEYVEETVKTGEWSTVVVSYDDTHDKVTTETDYTSDQNTKANYLYFITDLDANEVLGVDNITLWWVPASVSFNVTHDVEGILEDGTYAIGGGVKTIKEIEAILDPNTDFRDAGYYLAGLRDENGFYTDKVAFTENGKSYTAVWDRLNLLLSYSFDGTEDLSNVAPVTGSTGAVKDGEYITTSTADYASYRIDINNVSIPVADIGDIVYRIKNTGTGSFSTQYFVYVGKTEGTKTQNFKTTVPSEYTVISTTDLWGAPSTWMSSINTLSQFRLQGSALKGAVVHYDYIHVIAKNKDAGDNLLVDIDAPDCDLNSFKMLFDSTTTVQDVIDEVDLSDYSGKYFIKAFRAPDGTLLTGNDLIDPYVDDQDTLTAVWDSLNILDTNLEFDNSSILSKLGFRTGLNNALGSGFASIVDNSYMRVTFKGTDATKVIQDTGFNYNFSTPIEAGELDRIEMRVRFTGMPSVDTSLNQANGGTTAYTVTSVAWPEMYYNSAAIHDADNTISLFGKDGQWMIISYTAEEAKLSNVRLSQLRFDFFNFMPDGTTLDIDYIRFLGKALPNVTVAMEGKYGLEDVAAKFSETTTVADIVEKIDYVGAESVVGLTATKNGAALDNATLISSLGTDFITLYPVWGPNPDVGEYGDLLFEINFDKASTGSIDFGQGLKVLSNLGGFVGKRYAADETMFNMQNGSGSNYVAQTTEIVEREAGNKYLKATTNTTASFNLFQIYTGGSSYYTYEDGYLLLTYDILWGDSAASYPHDIAYNRSQQAEAGDQNETFYGVKNGGWGYVVSTFDDEIGVSGIGGNSATMLPTTVNYIKIHGSSAVKAGETYGIDNIRLWWVPKTTNVTVKAGTNPYVTEQTIAVKTTATVNDLISKVQTGNADVSLAGLSLTEDGELLAPDTLLTFPYGKTLYPKWSMPATLTVDMGTNTGATPVVLTYKGSDTIGDVLKKIVDHGDMMLKGLSRTPGGALLPENELVGTESEDLTLYTVWESYEYLENYGYEFNDGVLPYDSNVTTNNANRTLSVQDGYLTIDLAAKNGATGVYDTQIYLPLTTNSSTNPDKEIPAGVVTNVTARVRFRGTGTTSRTLSVDGRGNYEFNPENPVDTYIHWGAPGNVWGTNLTSYTYNYRNYYPDGIIDGRWFTLNFDTTKSGNLNLYDNGVGYLRFDFPYPMPDGTKIDIDYIRLVGDNDKVAYDGMSQYGEKVLEINFDNIAAGSQNFPEANNSNKTIATLGGEFNPAFNAANFESKIMLCASSTTTAEIVANTDGTGNYLKYTAGANGTNTYLYFRNFATQPFVREDGYYIVTYDVKNNTSSAVPHTFRFNYNNKIEHAADNFVITEDGEWDHVVLYFDKEINPEKVQNGYTLDSINDVDLIKWHNTSSSKTGETICIDNITLWYVPKTVPVIIDNSAIGLEETLIEAYPTNGMATEDIAALLPEFANGKFVGLSTVEGGDLLYENRSPVSQILYSNWSIDTTLTVDMGENKKLGNMSIQIPAGSSIKVSDIEAKFIDHGDKIFAGLSYTAGGAKLGSNEVISASESGAVTIYALWNDYYTNDFYSVEFDHKGEGVVTGAGSSHLNAGKNSAYKTDAKDANGNAAPGDDTQALVWNEEGYLTMNFVASDYAKAQAEDNGYSAIVWDPFMEIDTLYDETGDDTYLPAGSADYVVIRMRYRGMPAKNTAYWRADANSGAGGAYTLKPDNVFAPFYYYTTTEDESFGKTSKVKYVSLAEGSAYRENWFTVFIPASELTIDANNLYRFRLDPNDGMPDGSAIDVDFIRFIHTTDANKNFSAPDSREDRTSVRLARGKDDVDANGKERTGIRVIGEIATSTANPSAELGWMFTSSAKWNKSNGGSERSWYELKMDLYNPSSSFIKVGFIKEDGEQKVNFFENEGDLIKSFAAVLYNIPVKNYKSPFIVRPFAKMGNAYAYGEPFEINFLDTLEAIANSEGATPEVVEYYNECSAAYAKYLNDNASYNSSEIVASLNSVMSSSSSIKANLIIPTNDTAPTVSGNIVTMKAWKDGSLVTLNVSTKDTYPAIIDTNTNLLSDAYAEKPCVFYENGGVYYIRSLGRSTNAGGDYNGVEKNNPSAMEANVDASALFLSEINDVVSPFQRLPIDDELVNGKESFFLGDFATGEFDFTFQRANSATRIISTGKTGIIGTDSKVVAKYNFPNGTTEWVSFAQAQLLKMGIDNDSRLIADGIDFTNLTYVVSNNTTSVGSAINQREYEDLAVLAGVVEVPTTVNYTTTNFLAAKYNKVIVKTTSAASYVTVTFTRTDGVSDSIKYYAYGTTADGYRLFDVDLNGMGKYHSTIKSLTVKANSGSVSYAYLVEDPDYYSSADLANMEATMIFQDTNYQNGFYVRDMDQKMKKNEYVNYTFANNGNTPVWMIDPWYSYDYRDSANKASYELYNIASPTATRLADSQGTKVVEFTGSTKTSTYADGSSHTGPVLSMTLNSRAIYDGIKHADMVEAGMTYWPHLLIEQSRDINPVDAVRNSAGADKIFMEMDVQMPNYTVDKDSYFESVGSKILSFLLYSYIRPIESPNDKIWFGAQICSESNPNYPTWNRDTGGSAYIYSMPQEVVFQGISKSFYQQIEDEITETSLTGSGTDSTSMGWVHISIDVTPYIQTAIDWANREDAFGIGRPLTRDDFYFDGVNIGFETHGNIDGTFEIANFNFVAYNEK